MSEKKLYYDDPNGEVLSRNTSHPNFVTHLIDEIYYSYTDDWSPFGNDQGAETLEELENWYKKGENLDKPFNFIKAYINNSWDFDIKKIKMYLNLKDDKALSIFKTNEDPDFEMFFEVLDETIVAMTFGQYKIEGKITPQLKEWCLKINLRRIQISQEIWGGNPQMSNHLEKTMRVFTILQNDLKKIS